MIRAALAAALLELRARVEALEDVSWRMTESTQFCFDALVKRIEALEANSKPTPNPSQIRSSPLVERVADALCHAQLDSPSWEPEARAAIREVAAWMRENECGYNAVRWLEQEAKQ